MVDEAALTVEVLVRAIAPRESFSDVRRLAWHCRSCRYIKHFTSAGRENFYVPAPEEHSH